MGRGRLNIVVLGAKFAADFERKPGKDHELVCKLTVGKQKKKTHPLSFVENEQGETSSPHWNESFAFDVPEGIIALKMSLKEKGLLKDQVLGSCVVPLYSLPNKTIEERWFEVKKKDSKIIAEIQLRVQFLPNESLLKVGEQGNGVTEYPPASRSFSAVTVGEKEGIEAHSENGANELRCLSAQELPGISPGVSPSTSFSFTFEGEKKENFAPLPSLGSLSATFANVRGGSMRIKDTDKEKGTTSSSSFNFFRSINDKRKQKKSNLFRNLFNLPEHEELLFDMVASYVKRGNPLLIHGRLYLSQNFVCFFSNIFGIKTTEVICMDEIVSIEKQQAEGLEPGVVITTKACLYYFVTFGSHREKLHDRLMAVWNKDHKAVVQQEEQEADEAREARGADNTTEEEDEVDDEYLSAGNTTGEAGFLSAEKMTDLINEEFPVSVLKFFKLFFSDEPAAAQFLQTYHDKRGDTEFKILASWSHHPRFGMWRELQYRSPVNAPLGPKTTLNVETQRKSLQKDHLIVETISVLRDIPFGDSFRVEGHWSVTTVGKNRCHAILKVGVYFLKRVWIRGTIEEKTMKESAESYKIWLSIAREEARKAVAAAASASGALGPQPSAGLLSSGSNDSPPPKQGSRIISPKKVSPTSSLNLSSSNTNNAPIEKAPPSSLSSTTGTGAPSPTPTLTASSTPTRSSSSVTAVLLAACVMVLLWVIYLTWRVTIITSKLSALEELLLGDHPGDSGTHFHSSAPGIPLSAPTPTPTL